jgi:hypothetical protein
MSRDATPAAITESKAEVPRPFVFVELDYPGGFVRVNSTDREVTFNGNPYSGVGDLGSISVIGEGAGLQAQGVKLALSGIDPVFVSAAFENAQRRPGKVWVGFFDADFGLVIDPVLVFSGLIDNTTVDFGETATIMVILESRLITWERPKIQRYTNEAQQQLFPGDKFFEFLNQTVDKEIFWGISAGGVPRAVTVNPSSTTTFVSEPSGGDNREEGGREGSDRDVSSDEGQTENEAYGGAFRV